MSVKEPVLETPGFSSGVSWRISPAIRHSLDIIFALMVGAIIWHLPPAPPLDEKGMHFLATLALAVVFWVRESYDEYVVGLMLLFSWVVFEIAPTGVALSGFAKSSLIFVIAALGLGAAARTAIFLPYSSFFGTDFRSVNHSPVADRKGADSHWHPHGPGDFKIRRVCATIQWIGGVDAGSTGGI
jgi:hypothetical protein